MIKKGSFISLRNYIVGGRDNLVYCVKNNMVSYGSTYIVTKRYLTYINNIRVQYICFVGDKGYEVRLPVNWFYDIKEYRNRKINTILK